MTTKKKKQKRWKYPVQAEMQYRQYLLRKMEKWRNIINKSEDSIKKIIESYKKENLDSEERVDSWATKLDDLIKYYENQFNDSFNDLDKQLKRTSNQISNYNKAQFVALLLAYGGLKYRSREPWLQGYKDSFIIQNKQLIDSLIEDTLKQINLITDSGIKNNLTSHKILQQLNQKSKFIPLMIGGLTATVSVIKKASNRSILIAEDQSSSFSSQLQSKRCTSYGIMGYRWDTALDEKVRASHREREGKYFLFDYTLGIKIPRGYESTPPTANPGEEWNCRCFANPDFRWLENENF